MSAKPKFGAGNPKCYVCNKSVYHAERKDHEKEVFHNTCFNKWWKEKMASGDGTWGGKYDIKPDVQPAYYRADVDGSGNARMESGAEYKSPSAPSPQSAPTPSSSAPSSSSGGPKFCGNCGSPATGKKFCENCGGPL